MNSPSHLQPNARKAIGWIHAFLATMLLVSAPAISAELESIAVPAPGEQGPRSVRVRPIHDRFLDPQTFSGIHIANKYRLEADPGLRAGFHTRVESYSINQEGSSAFDLVQKLSPLGFNIHRGMRVTFARQFPTTEASKRAAPYTLAHLPVNSRLAQRLRPGDFASFTAHMDFLLTAGLSVTVLGPFGVGTSAFTAVSGDFLVQIFRLQGNYVRVRLLAMEANETGGDIGVKFGIPLALVGVNSNLLDKVSLTPIAFVGSKKRGANAFLDFQYDLGDRQSAEAFDRLLAGNFRLKNIDTRNPLAAQRYSRLRFHDVTATEALVRAGRVQQEANLHGLFQAKYRGVRINLGLLKIAKGSTTSSNKITVANAQGMPEYFLYETFSPSSLVSALFSAKKDEKKHGLRMLVRADSAFRARQLVSLSIVSERWVKNLRPRHLERMQNEVRTTLPEGVTARLDLGGLDFRAAHNGYLRFEVVFSEASLAKVRRVQPRALLPRLRRFLGAQDLADPGTSACSKIECFDQDLENVSELLYGALDAASPWSERAEIFRQLMKIRLFQRYGAAILVGLLPPEGRTQLVSTELLITAENGLRPVVFAHGSQNALWNNLRMVHEAIFGRPFINPLR